MWTHGFRRVRIKNTDEQLLASNAFALVGWGGGLDCNFFHMLSFFENDFPIVQTCLSSFTHVLEKRNEEALANIYITFHRTAPTYTHQCRRFVLHSFHCSRSRVSSVLYQDQQNRWRDFDMTAKSFPNIFRSLSTHSNEYICNMRLHCLRFLIQYLHYCILMHHIISCKLFFARTTVRDAVHTIRMAYCA